MADNEEFLTQEGYHHHHHHHHADEAEEMKQTLLSSSKKRKILARILYVIMTLLAIAVMIGCVYAYVFDR